MSERITADRLRDLLAYNTETGAFTWRVHRGGGARAGDVAGYTETQGKGAGYVRLMIAGKQYMAHDLAWLYVTGEWPPCGIDHKNVDRADNRWDNLRLASRSQNAANARLSGANTTGLKGVTQRANGRFVAHIRKDYQLVHLGYFDTREAAHAAYRKAAAVAFGEFARTE